MADTADSITLSRDGFSMPTVEVLTGRGFITGKSGSGKSNTTSVIAEELLEAGVPMLIVDTDGEYFGLQEQYEMLHVGGDEHCDKQVTPSHAENIAEVALEDQIPVILDISGFRDQDEGHELVGNVVEELFVLEKTARTPFLLIVEEAHEFMPEQGGLDELGESLIRVAKRGRKRGLGICALSQRPAAVTKDYITQCDWLVWHRLTWENDTKVVGRILGNDAADEVQELDTGEAIVMTDWDDTIQNVMFREKRTFDAGATPDLDDIDSPDLRTIDGEVMGQLASVDDVEDAEGAAKYNRGEDPDYEKDDGQKEQHIAEVYGTQAIPGAEDEDDAGDAESAEKGDGASAATADAPTDGDAANEDATDDAAADDDTATGDTADASGASGESAATGGTDAAPSPTGPEPIDLKDRSDLAPEADDATAESESSSDSSFVADLIPSRSSDAKRSAPPDRPSRSTPMAKRSSSTGSSSKVTVEDGSRRRGRRTRRPRDPEPSNDPAWEAAQFLTYVERQLVAGIHRTVATGAALCSRPIRWLADQLTETQPAQRRMEADLSKVLLVLVGILFGLVLAILLS